MGLIMPQSRNFLLDNISLTTGYCLTNGTCERRAHCGSGGLNLGCAIGGYSNEWKSYKLKSQYTEIGLVKARACLLKYFDENKNKYNMLQHLQINTLKIEDEPVPIFSGRDGSPKDPNDIRAYYAQISTEQPPEGGCEGCYLLQFNIGAQSCKIYSDQSVTIPFGTLL